jgi:hypothetical protein
MTDYERGYADAMNWKVQNHLEHLPSRQPQEPIAWVVYTQDGQSVYVTDNPIDIQSGQRALALYTAPRPWVGLTDGEIKEIIGPWGDTPIKGYTRKLFDQIEAKLKDKNT